MRQKCHRNKVSSIRLVHIINTFNRSNSVTLLHVTEHMILKKKQSEIRMALVFLTVRQRFFYFQRCWKILSCPWAETATSEF